MNKRPHGNRSSQNFEIIFLEFKVWWLFNINDDIFSYPFINASNHPDP